MYNGCLWVGCFPELYNKARIGHLPWEWVAIISWVLCQKQDGLVDSRKKAAACCAGLLKVGAGFMLAIGFSFAAYSAYSRFGNSNIFCCLSSDSLFIDNCSWKLALVLSLFLQSVAFVNGMLFICSKMFVGYAPTLNAFFLKMKIMGYMNCSVIDSDYFQCV
jgi:hypothetical protein